MAFNSAAMVVAADALRAACAYGQLHSAAAGTDGTSNVAAATRRPLTWTATSGLGDFSLAAQVDFVGGAAEGTVFSMTIWSAETDGTLYGEFPFTAGDSAFSAAGTFSVTAVDVTGAVIEAGS